MGDIKLFSNEISNMSSTMLMTLYCHSLESKSEKPILKDLKAEEIVDLINDELKKSESKLAKNLSSKKIKKLLRVTIAVRTLQYDKYAKAFLKEHPEGIVVNLGCGLDTRFHRIDNGKFTQYDIDLPEVIDLKKALLSEEERYKYLGVSVLDYSWMDIIKNHKKPVMFIAEGLFMYLPQAEVEKLITRLSSLFKDAILLCEIVNKKYTVGFYKKVVEYKLGKELKFGDKVTYEFGLTDSYELEELSNTIKLIEEWTYLDSEEKKLGWLRLFKNVKTFRTTQWTAMYKL